MIAILAGLGIMTMSMGSAVATPLDDYKFMGSVAAIAEVCYESEKIQQGLVVAVDRVLEESPESGPIFDQLIAIYNEAYYKAVVDAKIWIGSMQKFSRIFNCSSNKDVAMIKKMEAAILDNL